MSPSSATLLAHDVSRRSLRVGVEPDATWYSQSDGPEANVSSRSLTRCQCSIDRIRSWLRSVKWRGRSRPDVDDVESMTSSCPPHRPMVTGAPGTSTRTNSASASSMRSSGTCWNVLVGQPAENVESGNGRLNNDAGTTVCGEGSGERPTDVVATFAVRRSEPAIGLGFVVRTKLQLDAVHAFMLPRPPCSAGSSSTFRGFQLISRPRSRPLISCSTVPGSPDERTRSATG